jgi:hypothetical protein
LRDEVTHENSADRLVKGRTHAIPKYEMLGMEDMRFTPGQMISANGFMRRRCVAAWGRRAAMEKNEQFVNFQGAEAAADYARREAAQIDEITGAKPKTASSAGDNAVNPGTRDAVNSSSGTGSGSSGSTGSAFGTSGSGSGGASSSGGSNGSGSGGGNGSNGSGGDGPDKPGSGGAGEGTLSNGKPVPEPSVKHKTQTGRVGDLKTTGEPNSSVDLIDKDGNLLQRRFYGPDGKAITDIDFQHGGGRHEFPHEHTWEWSQRHPQRD